MKKLLLALSLVMIATVASAGNFNTDDEKYDWVLRANRIKWDVAANTKVGNVAKYVTCTVNGGAGVVGSTSDTVVFTGYSSTADTACRFETNAIAAHFYQTGVTFIRTGGEGQFKPCLRERKWDSAYRFTCPVTAFAIPDEQEAQ